MRFNVESVAYNPCRIRPDGLPQWRCTLGELDWYMGSAEKPTLETLKAALSVVYPNAEAFAAAHKMGLLTSFDRQEAEWHHGMRLKAQAALAAALAGKGKATPEPVAPAVPAGKAGKAKAKDAEPVAQPKPPAAPAPLVAPPKPPAVPAPPVAPPKPPTAPAPPKPVMAPPPLPAAPPRPQMAPPPPPPPPVPKAPVAAPVAPRPPAPPKPPPLPAPKVPDIAF